MADPADCNEALKLRPNYLTALDSRGFVLLRMGQYDAAIADYDAVLATNAGKVTSLYGRGTAKRRKGDYASGNADIAAARIADERSPLDGSAGAHRPCAAVLCRCCDHADHRDRA